MNIYIPFFYVDVIIDQYSKRNTILVQQISVHKSSHGRLGSLLLTSIHFNPKMDG